MSDQQSIYSDSVNPRSVEDGLEFEDFAVLQLNTKGFNIHINRSRKFQINNGDSLQGIEFKRDNLCLRTERLSIETAERVNLMRPWVLSGILKEDGCWGYCQGNLMTFWLFNKKDLRRLERWGRNGNAPLLFDETPTVRKFYLPTRLADEICILKFPEDWSHES